MLGVPQEKGKAKATKTTNKKAVDEGAKAKAAVEAQVPVAQDAQVEFGNKSNTLIFMNPLGDPSRDDVVKGKDGKDITTATIVGYRFKSTEDIVIPDCGTDIGLKSDRMNYVDPQGTRKVKAGEHFDLTPFEMACLLSRPEYNARATGGDRPVTCTYNMAGTRSKDGEIAKVSDASKVPSASLRALAGASIKDYDMINVINFTKTKNPNGTTSIERTPIAGFEKWAVLCQKVTRKAGVASGLDQKAKRNTNAQAFLNIVQQKKKKNA